MKLATYPGTIQNLHGMLEKLHELPESTTKLERRWTMEERNKYSLYSIQTESTSGLCQY
jgi:hypothetical protein